MLSDGIDIIKGVGAKYKKILNDKNIFTKKDLISFLPTSYNIYKKVNVEDIKEDENITIEGVVLTSVTIIGKMSCALFYISSSKGKIKVMAFGMDYLRYKIKKGMTITLFGLYKVEEKTLFLKEIFYDGVKEFIEPIYSINISNKILVKAIKSIFDENNTILSPLPLNILDKLGIKDYTKFLYDAHFPQNVGMVNDVTYINYYLKYLEYNLRLETLRYYYDTFVKKEKVINEVQIKEFINNLDFELTSDQNTAISEIINDMSSNRLLNRLVQGDVGSGKTIVSFIALYANYLAGYMGALMVPSEVLSKQHYDKALKLFEKYNIKVRLLNGSIKKSERNKLKEDIAKGNVDIVIGTHALFSQDIIYNNLGLVVIDEQHRFGVMERQTLINKGYMVDSLFLTATPIPRTLGISKYLDLDISTIKNKPSDRKKVLTKIVKTSDEDFIINAIKKNVLKGHQVYVVTPLIEQSSDENLYDIDKVYKIISSKIPDIRIGFLNGGMKDKDLVMSKFQAREFDVLISTTVIEVGIDIKNATLIVIYNADRFGLSTLHQLRGRVGRNEFICGCLLVSNKDSERLSIMEECSDCFKLSEMDLKIRGYGEILGVLQSGFKKFKINDEKAFEDSKEDAKVMYKNYLEGNKDPYVLQIINEENNVNKLN